MKRTGKTIFHGKMLVEFLPIFRAIEKPDQSLINKVKILDHITGPGKIFVFFKCAFGKVLNKMLPFIFRNSHYTVYDPLKLLEPLLIFHPDKTPYHGVYMVTMLAFTLKTKKKSKKKMAGDRAG